MQKNGVKVTGVQMDVLCDGKGKLHKLSPNSPIPHMVEGNGKYQIAKPAEQPKLQVEVQVDIKTYREFGMADKLQKKFTNRQGKFVKPPKAVFTADTGAQVDCVARNQLKRLGLSEKDLLEA